MCKFQRVAKGKFYRTRLESSMRGGSSDMREVSRISISKIG